MKLSAAEVLKKPRRRIDKELMIDFREKTIALVMKRDGVSREEAINKIDQCQEPECIDPKVSRVLFPTGEKAQLCEYHTKHAVQNRRAVVC